MDKYVGQLIADIYAAQTGEDFLIESNDLDQDCIFNLSFEEEFSSFFLEEKELFEKPFGETCGLKKNQFPPSGRLTDSQMEGICEAIERLLFSWNICNDLPENIPVAMAYNLLVSIFEIEVAIVSAGQTGIEFCESTPKKCVYGSYCECKKFDEERRLREKILGRDVLKIIAAIRMSPKNLPDPDVFSLIYPKSNLVDAGVPLRSMYSWLGFPEGFFPSADELTLEQMEAISGALLDLMNDNIRGWVSNISPKLRYISLVKYLSNKARYNGKNGFVLECNESGEINKLDDSQEDLDRFIED